MHLPKILLSSSILLTWGSIANAMRPVPPPFGWWPFDSTKFQDRRFHIHDSAAIYAWPSTGGRRELANPSPFELEFLNITDPLTECHKSDDPTEEDSFSLQLRKLGGTFYKYKYGRIQHHDYLEDPQRFSWLGWPTDQEHDGGVWVLRLTWKQLSHSKFEQNSTYGQTGRIRLARTMQERCKAIEMCGGTFFAEPLEEHLVPIEPGVDECNITYVDPYQRWLQRFGDGVVP